MNFFIESIKNNLMKPKKGFLFFILFLGVIISFMMVNPLTKLLFDGKRYWGRNFLYQLVFFLICYLVISVFLYGFGTLIRQLDFITLRINSWVIYIISFVYFYISLFIFIIGWTRLYIALPVTFLMGGSLFFFIRNWIRKCESESIIQIRINFSTLFFILIFWGVVLHCFGYSGFSRQSPDWFKDYAIISDLSNRDWPIYYHNNGEHSMLTYYMGQMMVPGFIGKIFKLNIKVAALIFGIWCYLGIILVYFGLLRVVNATTSAKQILCAFLFLFFDGLIIIAQFVRGQISPHDLSRAFSNDSIFIFFREDQYFQFTSNITAIKWLPQQFIVPWLIICLFLERPDDSSFYVSLGLPMLFYSAFMFIGFIPFLILSYVKSIINSQKKTQALFEIFSKQNALLLFSFGVVIFAYFVGYVSLEKPAEIALKLYSSGTESLIYSLIIGFLAFGVYSILIYRLIPSSYRTIFWCMVLVLFLLPFLQMGLYNDLVTRGNMPSLFILAVFVILSLFSEPLTKINLYNKTVLMLLFALGTIYPLVNMINACKNVRFGQNEMHFSLIENMMERTANRYDNTIALDIRYNSYTYDIEETIFFKYFAR